MAETFCNKELVSLTPEDVSNDIVINIFKYCGTLSFVIVFEILHENYNSHQEVEISRIFNTFY